MNYSYRSATLSKPKLAVLIVAGSLIAMGAAVLALSAYNRLYEARDSWHFFENPSLAWNLPALILTGIVLGTGWFVHEYRLYDGLEFRITKDRFEFLFKHRRHESYKHAAIKEMKTSPVFYGWFGLLKIKFRLKDPVDRRTKTRILLIRKADAEEFAKQLKAVQDRLLESRRATKQKNAS